MRKNNFILAMMITSILLLATGCSFSVNPVIEVDAAGFRTNHLFNSNNVDYGSIKNVAVKLDDFADVDIDINVGNVIIVSSDEYFLSYSFPEKLQPTYEVKEGTLYIKGTNVDSYSDLGNNKMELTISIPQDDILNYVSINNSMGDISIDGIDIIDLKVDDSMGDIIIKNGIYNKIIMNNSMGNIEIDNVVADLLDGNMSMGNSEISASNVKKINWYSSMGDISVDGDFHKLDLNSSMGNVFVNGKNCGENYKK